MIRRLTYWWIVVTFVFVQINANAQVTLKKDTSSVKTEKKKVLLKQADIWKGTQNAPQGANRILGNVIFEHEDILLHCDSAYIYQKTNTVDAFSHVHLIKSDTVHLFSDYLNYDGDLSYAKARDNVILQDPEISLFTNTLDFDMENDIGYYFEGGTIVDSTNTLTSKEAIYYTNRNLVNFKYDVEVDNDEYEVFADTLKYNTKSEIVYFDGKTKIIGDSTTMETEEGWFDTQHNITQLYKNSKFFRGGNELFADSIFYTDSTGEGNALGNVVLHDTNNNMIISGMNADYEDHTNIAVITDSAMFVHYNEGDSLFLHADTLLTHPDAEDEEQKLLAAYYNVRFFRTDLQGICDSLNYFTKDSTIEMYLDPVAWSEDNQMSADFIEFITNPQPPNLVNMLGNSFIIQQFGKDNYNQIKGKDMTCYIRGRELYQIDVNGSGQSLYYPQEENEDSTFSTVGANFAQSSKIKLYLRENRINRINFMGAPDGVLNPLDELNESDKKLQGFKWMDAKRPYSKFEIFHPRDKAQSPIDSLGIANDSLRTTPALEIDSTQNSLMPVKDLEQSEENGSN